MEEEEEKEKVRSVSFLARRGSHRVEIDRKIIFRKNAKDYIYTRKSLLLAESKFLFITLMRG